MSQKYDTEKNVHFGNEGVTICFEKKQKNAIQNQRHVTEKYTGSLKMISTNIQKLYCISRQKFLCRKLRSLSIYPVKNAPYLNCKLDAYIRS